MLPRMSINRRDALKLGALAPLAFAAARRGAAAIRAGQGGPFRFAVSTYSYWHFEQDKYPIEKVIEQAAGSASTASRSCTARWRTRRRPT